MKPNLQDEERSKPRTKAKGCQFSLPPEDVEHIERLRARYQKLALEKSDKPADIVKSEIVRAGIHALIKLSDTQFFKCIENLEVLQEGRPPKQKADRTEEKD